MKRSVLILSSAPLESFLDEFKWLSNSLKVCTRAARFDRGRVYFKFFNARSKILLIDLRRFAATVERYFH